MAAALLEHKGKRCVHNCACLVAGEWEREGKCREREGKCREREGKCRESETERVRQRETERDSEMEATEKARWRENNHASKSGEEQSLTLCGLQAVLVCAENDAYDG